MDKFDEALREALGEEERKVWDELVDPTPLQMAGDLFRGHARWIQIIGVIEGLAFLGLGIWTLSRFLAADEVLVAMRWAVGFLMCMWALWALKMWSWMQMQRYALTRELKRVELQIVNLGSELRRAAGD